jgi:hypothetical protein
MGATPGSKRTTASAVHATVQGLGSSTCRPSAAERAIGQYSRHWARAYGVLLPRAMMPKRATVALGVGLVAAMLAACSTADEAGETTSAGQSGLRASEPIGGEGPDAGGADTGTGDSGDAAAPKPPEKCKERAPDGTPPVECVDFCRKALSDNPAYQCVEKALSQLGGTGLPSKESMAACGCSYEGEGFGVFDGGRPLFSCPGTPPFMVSPVPGEGMGGIGVLDPVNFPSCFFDISAPGGPGTPVVVQQPSDTCMNCHDPASPKLPLVAPMPGVIPPQAH